MSPRMAFALDAAVQAGRLTLGWFQNHPNVELKADASPVTAADRAAERHLREAIEKAYPGEPILGEEEGGSQQAERWVIDPIDGTKSFICGVPLYATLLSFEQEGMPILGVCYLPALGELYYAELGGGAFMNGRAIHVSKKASLEGSILSCGGHRSMINHHRMEPFLKLAESALVTRTWGDAYGHALVACGRIDAMIDPAVARWDVSPMALIVNEAGGKCTNFAGTAGVFDEALSSNGQIHAALVKAFEN